jgi:Fe-S-cluster containining protein
MDQYLFLPIWTQIASEFTEGEGIQLSDDLMSYIVSTELIKDLPVMTSIGQRLYDHLTSLEMLKEDPLTYYPQFLKLYDEIMESSIESLPEVKHHFCKSGCANCCYQPVRSTKLEALFLYEKSKSEMRLDIAQSQALFLNKKLKQIKDWKDHFTHKEQACPLLDIKSGQCKSYEWRPLACRNYYALNTDKFCAEDPSTIVDIEERKKARMVRYLEPAILASALTIIDGGEQNYKWFPQHISDLES